MIDKETQLDFSENIKEVIYFAYRKENRRKVSVPVIPVAYCFKVESEAKPVSRRFSRCGSKREIRPVIKRNLSEVNLAPRLTQVSSVVNLTFSHNPQSRRTRAKH